MPLEHSYPVHTSRQQGEARAEPEGRQPAAPGPPGQAGRRRGPRHGGLEATGTEGYFLVWTDKQDREAANLFVKVI